MRLAVLEVAVEGVVVQTVDTAVMVVEAVVFVEQAEYIACIDSTTTADIVLYSSRDFCILDN